MPKIVVSIDDVVIKEVSITDAKTTLGRRPYNDVVIDNLAVSGEHALLTLQGADYFLEDLNSTNGTYINGKAIKRQRLSYGDAIEIGKYVIKFMADLGQAASGVANARGYSPSSTGQAMNSGYSTLLGESQGLGMFQAAIKVLSGASSGREVPLTKVVTTIGKPGVAVAAITRRPEGYVVHHVEGSGNPTLNGSTIQATQLPLKNGDIIELAGTQMQFVQL
ncbi:MAG: FHA domain-containing protein [Rhodoferax sp.]|nr:FHA domain-containing protein [Rhodoferax sp.]